MIIKTVSLGMTGIILNITFFDIQCINTVLPTSLEKKKPGKDISKITQ